MNTTQKKSICIYLHSRNCFNFIERIAKHIFSTTEWATITTTINCEFRLAKLLEL